MEKEKPKSNFWQNLWNAASDIWAGVLAIGVAVMSAITTALQWLSQGYIKSGWLLPVELLLTLFFTIIAIIKAIRKQRKAEKDLQDFKKEFDNYKAEHKSIPVIGEIDARIYNNYYQTFNLGSGQIEDHQLPALDEKISRPNRQDLSYQMGLDIQKFGSQFQLIRSNDDSYEIVKKYTVIRNILNTILDDWIPKSNLVLTNSNEIREKVFGLNYRLNQYGWNLNMLFGYRIMERENPATTRFIPEQYRLEIIKCVNLLWGGDENSLYVQIKLLVEDLVGLLHEEGQA